MPRKDPEARKKFCHERYVKNRDSEIEKSRAYYRKNAEKIIAYQKQYRIEHADHFKAYEESRKEKREVERKEKYDNDPVYREERLRRAREWKAKNKQWCIDNKKKWDAENIEHVKEYGKKRRAEIPEKLSQEFRRWRLNNPEYMRAHASKRRAIKLGSPGHFTSAEIRELWNKQKGKCAYGNN